MTAFDPSGVLLVAHSRVDVVDEFVARTHVGVRAVDDLGAADVALVKVAERRVEVVVVVDHARFDERVRGQVALLGIGVEVIHGAEMLSAPELLEHGGMQNAGEREHLHLVEVDLPTDALVLQAVEDGGRLLRVEPLVVAPAVLVRDEAVRGGRMEERAVAERLRGHGAEPVVEHGELPCQRRQGRQHVGRERAHDVLCLVSGGGCALLQTLEVDDVVMKEPAHGGVLAVLRGVVRRLHALDVELRVARGLHGAEDLSVDVRELVHRDPDPGEP